MKSFILFSRYPDSSHFNLVCWKRFTPVFPIQILHFFSSHQIHFFHITSRPTCGLSNLLLSQEHELNNKTQNEYKHRITFLTIP